MKFEYKTAGKVFAAVQFYYGVDVVFPETVLKTTIYRFAIIFCHQIQVIYRFVDKGSRGQRESEVCTDGGTVKMVHILIIPNIGTMNAQFSHLLKIKMFRCGHIITTKEAVVSLVIT